jgi:hypothetical protein
MKGFVTWVLKDPAAFMLVALFFVGCIGVAGNAWLDRK